VVGAWFRIVRYLLLAGLVLLIGAAAFQLVTVLGSDTLGIPRASGPPDGLGAGAAVLMLFVLPPLIVGLVIFMLGWGVGWMLREATKPDRATAEKLGASASPGAPPSGWKRWKTFAAFRGTPKTNRRQTRVRADGHRGSEAGRHHRLDQPRDLGSGQRNVLVPTLAPRREETCGHQVRHLLRSAGLASPVAAPG
jgi:hypothetical protein